MVPALDQLIWIEASLISLPLYSVYLYPVYFPPLYMPEIVPIRRKTLSNQPINQSINQYLYSSCVQEKTQDILTKYAFSLNTRPISANPQAVF